MRMLRALVRLPSTRRADRQRRAALALARRWELTREDLEQAADRLGVTCPATTDRTDDLGPA